LKEKLDLAGPRIRWGVVAFTTALGAAWLLYKGPTPVVRATTPLSETTPFWYMLSAFPVLGMLLADLVFLLAVHGFGCAVIELGLQVVFLVAASSLRLTLRLPISGHILLFAYFLLRRFLVGAPTSNNTARIEVVFALLSYAVASYVKLFRWSDPITWAVGAAAAGAMALVSFIVSKLWRGR